MDNQYSEQQIIAALVSELLALEWSEHDTNGDRCCHTCGAMASTRTHSVNCTFNAALQKAGVRQASFAEVERIAAKLVEVERERDDALRSLTAIANARDQIVTERDEARADLAAARAEERNQ